MKKAVLCCQPSVSLKNASTLISLCLMSFREICPLAIWSQLRESGHNKNRLSYEWSSTHKLAHTHTSTATLPYNFSSTVWQKKNWLNKWFTGKSNTFLLENDGEPHPPIRMEIVSNIWKYWLDFLMRWCSRHMWRCSKPRPDTVSCVTLLVW